MSKKLFKSINIWKSQLKLQYAGCLAAVAALVLGCLTGILLNSTSIALKEQNIIPVNCQFFPDPVFRKLITDFDVDQDGNLNRKEWETVTEIFCQNMGILSIEGIRYFPNLETLDCIYNFIANFPIEENLLLTELHWYPQFQLHSVTCNFSSDSYTIYNLAFL